MLGAEQRRRRTGWRSRCDEGAASVGPAADVADWNSLPVMSTPPPVGPYTPIVRAGDWLVSSGQIGLRDGEIVTGGVDGELRQAMANLEALLASEGATLTDVVKTTVFLRHMSDYLPMNDAYVDCFGEHRPARSAVGVAELPLGALVEIEAWAHVPSPPATGAR